MPASDYQQAYLREKSLREQAESSLSACSHELQQVQEQLRNTEDHLQQQQQAMLQSEKMASLGVLAAGVAHEINNPMGFIFSNFSSLVEGLKDIQNFINSTDRLIMTCAATDDIRAGWLRGLTQYDIHYVLDDYQNLAEETLDGLERVKQIVADLRSFTRQDGGNKTAVDVNDCLRAALNILNNQTRYRAQLCVDYGELPDIQGYFGRLNQVFVNLIANANQAIEENGRIHISTAVQDDWIEVRVEDNGHGISEENMQHLFTPFFTTKPAGLGTGLGLSISRGVIAEHGGDILVESHVGQGTTFTVRLPLPATII